MNSLNSHLILAPDASIDLQLHTVASDGTWTPEQLVDYLMSEQFALAAVTDHDRVDTISSLQGLAAQRQFPLLVAVEMSTSWRGEATDVLCYGFAPGENKLSDLAQDIMRRQCENTREAYEYLYQRGYLSPESEAEPLQSDELAAILEKPSAQQYHELAALVKKHGYGAGKPSLGEILDEAGCSFVTNDIATVVDAAHHDGGVCLIAHPGRGKDFTRYDASLLDQLREDVSIDGIEVYYPDHTPEQIAMYATYAQKHHLLTSSGSDSHGPNRKPIKYRAELSRRLLEHLGIQIK